MALSKMAMFERIRRSPERIRASYPWSDFYDAYQQITGKAIPEATKTRWRRLGKILALSDLEGMAKNKGYDTVFAWSTEDLGMRPHVQQSLF